MAVQATYEIHFQGGPCDGTSRTITRDQFAVGSIACQNVTYVYSPTQSYGARIVYLPATKAQRDAKGARAFDPTAVAAAWRRLTHVLAVRAPHHIRRQHAANARLRRIAR